MDDGMSPGQEAALDQLRATIRDSGPGVKASLAKQVYQSTMENETLREENVSLHAGITLLAAYMAVLEKGIYDIQKHLGMIDSEKQAAPEEKTED